MSMVEKGAEYEDVQWHPRVIAACTCDYGTERNRRLARPLGVYSPDKYVRVSWRSNEQIKEAIAYWRAKNGKESQ